MQTSLESLKITEIQHVLLDFSLLLCNLYQEGKSLTVQAVHTMLKSADFITVELYVKFAKVFFVVFIARDTPFMNPMGQKRGVQKV